MATRFKSVIAFLTLALAMGCVAPAPLPTATPEPFLARQLDVKIDPKEAASYLLNPSPLGKGGYSKGMIVTIDILPQPGWQVEEWVGPVFNVDGRTAKIQMDSSQAIAVILKSTTPTNTPTDTPIPPTAAPTDTPAPATATPTSTRQAIGATAIPAPIQKRPLISAQLNIDTPRPPVTTARPPATPGWHYLKGREYDRVGKYQMAVDEFTTVIRLDRSFTSAYWDRAMAYLALGQYQAAIQDIDKTIQVAARAKPAYYNWRGYAYYMLGQYERAIGDYNEAIRLSRTYATAYSNRSWAYRGLGKYAEADADKAKACSLDKFLKICRRP